MSISILIPAYNEEKYIKGTILETLSYLKKLKLDFEIIIIPNGCSDKTELIAKELSKNNKKIKYVVSKKGAGNAIKKGIKYASKDIITWVFADGEMDYSFIKKGLELMNEYDLVTGARVLENKKFGVKEDKEKGFISNSLRRFLSKSCRLFSRYWIPLPISEIGILKMFKRRWAQKNLNLRDPNWGIQAEILLQAGLDKLKIKEIPIKIELKRHTSESRLNVFQEMISLLKSITKAGVKVRLTKLKRLFSKE